MKKTKIALSSPKIRLADCEYNATLCINAARDAETLGAQILVFPELTLTGATLGDLFLQEAVHAAAERALKNYIEETADISLISFIGLPLFADGKIYNAMAAVSGGELLGVSVEASPKDRVFSAAPHDRITVKLCGSDATLSDTLLYANEDTRVKIFCEVGYKDTLSSAAALSGADIIVNPVAMPEYIGLARRRRIEAEGKSSSSGAVYAMCGAGEGESGTDGIYASPRIVVSEEGVCEADLFSEQMLVVSARGGLKSAATEESSCGAVRYPFIPEDKNERDAACELALEIQSRALAARIERSYSKCAVIGVSGGLDSTLALLVCARAMDILGRERDAVHAITMPCFGTSERTKSNALALAEELSCTVRTIDIKAAVTQHFRDISHDEKNYNVVYENAQARERTQILMDVANAEGGLVVGTGDLSELALGFATYNGDHMSMYCVNGSVPKTLMREIIAYAAKKHAQEGRDRLSRALLDVINTPVSPELLPTEDGSENAQHTEKIVGPYELHDFFLYYTVTGGYAPDKILSLAKEVFSGDYDEVEIKGYLEIFVRRFYSQQFKRSCMPDGPRVTEISLSPRGAWRMPSDVCSNIWKEYFKK